MLNLIHRRPETTVVDVTYALRNVGHSIAQNLFPFFTISGHQTGHECERTEEDQKLIERANGGIVIFPETGFTTSGPPTFATEKLGPGARLIACVSYRITVDSQTHYTKIPYFIDDPSTLDKNSPIEDIKFHPDINGTYAN